MLEAFLMISQDDQRVSGTRGIGSFLCDGHRHHRRVRVQPLEGNFSPGTANASAFLLIEDPASSTCVRSRTERRHETARSGARRAC